MQLALDLAQGRGYSSGYPIEQYEHHYDLSYGVNLHKSHPLKSRYVGKKYYCYKNLTDIDMAKKIVHIYDQDNRKATQKFYRLIDKASGPGLNDNTYDRIDEVTGIDAALQKARDDFQAQLRKTIGKMG